MSSLRTPLDSQKSLKTFEQYSPARSVQRDFMAFQVPFSTCALKVSNTPNISNFFQQKIHQSFSRVMICKGNETPCTFIRNWINWATYIRMHQLKKILFPP